MGAVRVIRLAVNVASHTPRLAAASVAFRNVLDDASIKHRPATGVRLFSGIDGSAVLDVPRGLDKLAEQISHPSGRPAWKAVSKRERVAFSNWARGGGSPRWPQVPIPTFPPVAWKTSGRCRVSAHGWAAVLRDRRRMRLISDVRLSTLSASDGQATK
jgi:hypothetical protein